jgi:uncharacterized protein
MTTFQPPQFSDGDFDLLEALLMRRSKGITDIVELEGFMTALVVGPATLMPSAWLPKLFGGKDPGFNTEEQFGEFVRLVMGLYNDIVLWFEGRQNASNLPSTNVASTANAFSSWMSGAGDS